MDVVILAGGLGTRLKSVVSDIPKVMAPVNNKPFLEYILEELNNQNIKRVVLAVGYKKEIIQEYFGNKYKNIDILYSYEETPLGTGGAIRKALELVDTDNVIVMNGDIYTRLNYKELEIEFIRKQTNIMLVIKHMKNFDRYGTIEVQNNKIVNFKEKQPVSSGYMSVGCYVFNKKILSDYMINMNFSIEKDFFSKYVLHDQIDLYKYDNIFVDIGIPKDYNYIKELLK